MKLEQAHTGRNLGVENRLEDMADWIIDDPTITNMAECTEYVAAVGEDGLFAHDSEHALFQILTPLGAIRLSHGRLVHTICPRIPLCLGVVSEVCLDFAQALFLTIS